MDGKIISNNEKSNKAVKTAVDRFVDILLMSIEERVQSDSKNSQINKKEYDIE